MNCVMSASSSLRAMCARNCLLHPQICTATDALIRVRSCFSAVSAAKNSRACKHSPLISASTAVGSRSHVHSASQRSALRRYFRRTVDATATKSPMNAVCVARVSSGRRSSRFTNKCIPEISCTNATSAESALHRRALCNRTVVITS